MQEYDHSGCCLEGKCLLVLLSSLICITCTSRYVSRLVEGTQSIQCQWFISSEVSVNAVECDAWLCLPVHCKCALHLRCVVTACKLSVDINFELVFRCSIRIMALHGHNKGCQYSDLQAACFICISAIHSPNPEVSALFFLISLSV